jgi:hypothetical protein
MREESRGYLLVAATAIGGLIAGAGIMLIANQLSAVGPLGDGWSFRGDGSLVIPFGLRPVVIATGWTLLVLHDRSHPRWVVFAIVAAYSSSPFLQLVSSLW